MSHWIRNPLLLGMVGALLGLTAAPVHASSPLMLRGFVEHIAATPDSYGEWRIDGETVVVGPQTRLQEHVSNVRTDGYWTQASTGVVVRAPGWSDNAAHAAGFRPALPAEVGGITHGRLVKATVRADEHDRLQAVEIEVMHDEPDAHAHR